jgi:hypothetical protein
MPAAAQQVEVRGRGDIDTDAYLRALVARGDFVLIARDTLLVASDTVHGNALAVRATVRIDGVVTGDLIIVDANVFLRPNARILGGVRNIGGGYYPSERAVVHGRVHNEPDAPYIVRRERDGALLVILGTTHPSRLVRPGLFGFAMPAYDRVDGLTLSYGAGLLLPRVGRTESTLNARVDYRSQRGAVTGGGDLTVERGATSLAIGAERATLTNERWIRDDATNTISFFFAEQDLRDYYEADRAWAQLRRTLETGPRTTAVFLRAQIEDARSLHAGTPWTVAGTPRLENLPADDGRIGSVSAGGTLAWTQRWHVVRLNGLVEVADRVLAGAHDFARYAISADWAMAGFANHTLRIQPHFQGPLPGTRSLPRQRWSFIGGPGTLYTFDIAAFRGDRIALIETHYSIPLDPVRVSFLGTPELEALHLAGMAWTAATHRKFEQNLGLRLRFPLVSISVVTNPAAPIDDAQIAAGANLPRRSWPWERE